MAAEGLSIDWYVLRHRDEAEVLPWDHISAGLHKDFLWQDWQGALAEHGLEDCRWTPCYDCGVCTGYGLEHVVASPVAPAGGSQGTGQDLSRGHVVPVDLGVRREPVGVGVQERKAVRLRYAKEGKVRWTSHRDAARIWERALRRAGLAVAYTEGFSPRPRLHFGLALPTGYESDVELLDVDLVEQPAAAARPSGAAPAALPPGFAVTAAAVLEGGEPSLQQDVTSCSWRIELRQVTPARPRPRWRPPSPPLRFPWPAAARATRPSTTCGRASSPCARDHHARRSDRPAGRSRHPTRSTRPSELGRVLPEVAETIDITHRVRRTHQWIERDGARREPLPVPATSQPHASGSVRMRRTRTDDRAGSPPWSSSPEPADGEPARALSAPRTRPTPTENPPHRSSSVAPPASRLPGEDVVDAGRAYDDRRGGARRLLRREHRRWRGRGGRRPRRRRCRSCDRRPGPHRGRRRPPGPLPWHEAPAAVRAELRQPTPRSCPTCPARTGCRIRRPPSGCSCASLRSATPGRPPTPAAGRHVLRSERRPTTGRRHQRDGRGEDRAPAQDQSGRRRPGQGHPAAGRRRRRDARAPSGP